MSAPSLAAVRPLLHRLGLDDREVDVYLALLAMKSAKASALATAAGQSRSHTYLILRALMGHGLVSEVDKGGVLHFVAESPSSLLSLAENRSRELLETGKLLEGTLPLLQSLSSTVTREPRVTLLYGLDGVRQIYREMFRNEYVSFFNAEPTFKAFGKNPALDFLEDGLFHGRDLVVDNEAAKQYLRDVKPHAGHVIRLLPKSIIFPIDSVVCEDSIALFAYDERCTIVRIENKNIADAFRAWFDAIWPMGKPVSK